MARLEETHHFTSPQPPAALLTVLADHTEPIEWPPELILKLSGVGIICRVMASPKTSRPFFGLVAAERIRLAVSNEGRDVTPFQPILLLSLHPDSTGSRLDVKLRPHRQARSFTGLFAGLGVLVILAALPAALGGDLTALVGMLVGAGSIVFPGYRARASFQADRDRALIALKAALPDLKAAAPQSPDQ